MSEPTNLTSMGLGIPFIISALILDKLKGVFNFIKRNYKVINIISGGLLIILGIAMMTGLLGKLLAVITF
jgi:cytochrome c-type biogenesis protein